MKRYIEVVYDNSGSMNNIIGTRPKYEIARDLFEKEILPTIGFQGDHVVLRYFNGICAKSNSIAEVLPNNRAEMLARIKTLEHNQLTPLLYTIYDSIQACRTAEADEYLIFVLTDGDDTCTVEIKKLFDDASLKSFISICKVLLVQFAVESNISRNNLTSFTNYLGGQTIFLDRSDSTTAMRKKLKTALKVSGFNKKLPLDPCFTSLAGPDKNWEDLHQIGFDFHQATLLFQKNLLTWEPDYNSTVNALDVAELNFLHALFFVSGLPEDLIKTMLKQLKKPYHYSYECIFWDFSVARWRYFVPQNEVQQLPNPEVQFQDVAKDQFQDVPEDQFDNQFLNTRVAEDYYENLEYVVKTDSSNMIISYQLDVYKDTLKVKKSKKIKILRKDDIVIFRK